MRFDHARRSWTFLLFGSTNVSSKKPREFPGLIPCAFDLLKSAQAPLCAFLVALDRANASHLEESSWLVFVEHKRFVEVLARELDVVLLEVREAKLRANP
jgi:hypothetical protein